MKTDDLIDLLARDAQPVDRAAWKRKLALTLLAGLALAAAIIIANGWVRPDIGAAVWPTLLKAGFAALAAAAALPLAMRLAQPGQALGWRIASLGVFALIAALATGIALIGAPVEDRFLLWMGRGFPWCLVWIPLLAAPTAVALLWFMRALAPTRLMLSGAAIGALAGGIASMAYAMYCPVDSVAFVTTWYALAIAVCAVVGAIIGSKFLRW